MTFKQFFFFRRGRYELQVPTKCADKRKHRKSIKRKQKQIDDATWNINIYANLWALALTGGASSIGAVICLRNRHVAREKLRILEAAYLEKYNEKVEWKKRERKGAMKRMCGCITEPVIGVIVSFDYDSDSDDEKDDNAEKGRGSGKVTKAQTEPDSPTSNLSFAADNSDMPEVRTSTSRIENVEPVRASNNSNPARVL